MIALWLSVAQAACDGEPRVAYDGETFTATFCTHGGAWAGATLRRASDGMQFDVPAVEAKRAEEVAITAKVGPGFVQYVLGSWEEKDESCTSQRHGCQEYGYDLRSVVWTWPRYMYDITSFHHFADFEPARIQVLDAGGGSELVRRARGVTSDLPIVDGGKAGTPRTEIEILYRGRWDRARAWQIASALRKAEVGFRWTVKHWPEAPDAFVVAVGGP